MFMVLLTVVGFGRPEGRLLLYNGDEIVFRCRYGYYIAHVEIKNNE